MHAYGPATWYRGVNCFPGEIEQSSLDSAEGGSTEKESCGDKTRKTSVVRKSVAYVTVNVLSVPRFSSGVALRIVVGASVDFEADDLGFACQKIREDEAVAVLDDCFGVVNDLILVGTGAMESTLTSGLLDLYSLMNLAGFGRHNPVKNDY